MDDFVDDLALAHSKQADSEEQAEQRVSGHLSVCHLVDLLLLAK